MAICVLHPRRVDAVPLVSLGLKRRMNVHSRVFRFIRFFIFPVYESPKFLASIGKDEAAVEVIHRLAKRNGTTTTLSVDDLRAAAAPYLRGEDKVLDPKTKFTTLELIKHSFDDVRGEHIRALFSTPRLAYSTSLVIFCYAALGLAYPLFNGFLGTYLAEKNASFGNTSLDATYAGYTYQAACGVPGSMLAAVMVEWGRGGRKFAMAFFTISAGCFLFGLTRARNGTTIDVLTCFASFFENAFCECQDQLHHPHVPVDLPFFHTHAFQLHTEVFVILD